jgi:hypothetical protein
VEAGRSLRELFAELSSAGGADPSDLLRAAGYGDVPEPLVTEAIVNYAATAPLEVAEHLAPFAVAHGPVPVHDPAVDPADTRDGLSLLASAPAVDAHGGPSHAPSADITVPPDADHHTVADDLDAGHLADHLDLDPSVLDDTSAGPHGPVHHADLEPAGIHGLDPGTPHPGPGPHSALGSFGAGHDREPSADTDDQQIDDRRTDDGATAHHGETFLAHDHVQDVAAYDHDVSDHDVADHEPETAAGGPTSPLLLGHDAHADPADLLEGDEHHDL